MKLSYHRTPSPSAFTLIELPVAIAIIAILAAILFPVFARARENARRSSCQSNLKQIGLGFLQYSQDFDERFPPRVLGGSNWGWIQVTQPYIKSLQLYQCPSEPTAGPTYLEHAYWPQKQTDYFYNKRLTNYDGATNSHLGISLAQVQSPALSVMSGDDVTTEQAYAAKPEYDGSDNGEACTGIIGNGTATNCGPHALDQTAAKRHLESANYLFCDGHVKSQKPTQLYGAATTFAASGNSPTFHIND